MAQDPNKDDGEHDAGGDEEGGEPDEVACGITDDDDKEANEDGFEV